MPSYTAQTGVLSFGPAASKTVGPTSWYKHKASDIDLAVIDDQRLGPPEVGGTPFPTFPYKAGVMVAGGALINPRLEDSMGWVLFGAMGAKGTSAARIAPLTGVYDHPFKTNNVSTNVKWMGFRKAIPSSDNLGETYLGCKVIGYTINLPNDGLITLRVDVLGRDFIWGSTAGWTYANAAFEGFGSIPIGCTVGGYLKVPTFSASALPVVGATFTFVNTPLDIRQEKIFGSPLLEDITTLMRVATVDLLVKWSDSDMYQRMISGDDTGAATTWTARPWTSDLEIFARTPFDIGATAATANPFELKIEAPRVHYQPVGGIRLAGNNAMMLRVTGTVLEPDDPSVDDYLTVTLTNGKSNYVWP